MALFFDAGWFGARLAALGMSRELFAMALGLDLEQLDEMWKDQREISSQQVATMAALLGVTAEEVAKHAGVSTPIPRPEASKPETSDIAARLDRIERELAELKALLSRRS